jgi:hypothetical protein
MICLLLTETWNFDKFLFTTGFHQAGFTKNEPRRWSGSGDAQDGTYLETFEKSINLMHAPCISNCF